MELTTFILSTALFLTCLVFLIVLLSKQIFLIVLLSKQILEIINKRIHVKNIKNTCKQEKLE